MTSRIWCFIAFCLLLSAVLCRMALSAGGAVDLHAKAAGLYMAGKHEEALKAAGDALADMERKYGEQGLELSESLKLLAEIQRSRQEFQKAADILERLRSIQESNLGPRSTKVATSISDLIAVYEQMGQHQKAESLNEIACKRWSKERPSQGPVLTAHAPPPRVTPSLKDIESYAKIMVTLADYRKKHTYSTEDFFVCADMVIDVWNILKTQGIRSKITVGNVERDLRYGTTDTEYIAGMNHAWLLAEVKPNEWIPLEATGGYIVDPNTSNYSLYMNGISFENPKQFKAFSDLRLSYFKTCREANSVVDAYNSHFAGKTATRESLEYRGRALQKFEECKQLANGVMAHLKR